MFFFFRLQKNIIDGRKKFAKKREGQSLFYFGDMRGVPLFVNSLTVDISFLSEFEGKLHSCVFPWL